MPRKYRPPAAKRRKNRTAAIPYESDSSSEETTALPADDATDDGAPLLTVDVAELSPEPEDRPLQRLQRTVGERHVARDYSYVRGEVVRIAAMATLIIVALVITAILRN